MNKYKPKMMTQKISIALGYRYEFKFKYSYNEAKIKNSK